MLCCSLQGNCLFCCPLSYRPTLIELEGIQCFAQWLLSRSDVYGCLHWVLEPWCSWKWILKSSFVQQSYMSRSLCQQINIFHVGLFTRNILYSRPAFTTSVWPPSFTFSGLPLRRRMNPSSRAAPSLWSWTRWSSPPLPPCPGCNPRGPNPKGKASIPLPHPPLTPTSRAAKLTTRSQRACCSWPRTRAKTAKRRRGRRRRRRRAKGGLQVENGEGEGWMDGFTLSFIIHSHTVSQQVGV